METIQELFLVLLSAVILQNTLLARGLIPGRDDLKQACSGHVWAFGAGLGLVACLSTLLSWPLYKLVQRSSLLHEKAPVRYFIVLICLCLSYLFWWGITRRFFPGLHYILRGLLSHAAFGCAAFGSILIALSSTYRYGLGTALLFVAGSSLGYTLVLWLIREGKARLAFCDVPRPFRGAPILLLYIGLLSLAAYGLIGHQLPT